MSDEFEELEKGEVEQGPTEEETPEQIMERVKSILLQKFKEAGVEKYDYTSPLTKIRITYDGQKVEITYNGKDATEVLSKNSFVNTAFSHFIQAKISELERMAQKRKMKK